MIRLALHSALSDRVAEGRVAVLDRWGFTEPRTKDAKAVLDALGIEGKVMVVVDAEDAFAIKSLRNLPEVTLVTSNEINAYDVLCSDWVLFTRDVLPGTTVEVEGAPVDGPVDEPEAVDEPESVVEPEAEAADEPEAEAADEPEAVVEPEAPDEADAADEETDA
jgi:large subunit ribosomal protein L4